ncbi:MAG: hypothetical protein A2Y92_00705 [Chloroflexi bacterium RBG_13_57_8]|nr:MAG: hypothetical protein A2Y92_00705 [Chloroflexi bacterium RBG_13_57_8]
MTGETFMESNHVWLMVNSGEMEIAYDWGTPRFDRQHYEGFPITIDYLLSAIAQDAKGEDVLAAMDEQS